MFELIAALVALSWHLTLKFVFMGMGLAVGFGLGNGFYAWAKEKLIVLREQIRAYYWRKSNPVAV